MNALIYEGKNKVAQNEVAENEKRNKYMGFHMAGFSYIPKI